MTIQEIRMKKEVTEEAIVEIIKLFEGDTGVVISGLQFNRTYHETPERLVIAKTEVKIKIEI
jgi:hypothetical protein